MEPHPDKRPTSEKAMEHAWVASLQSHRAHISKPTTPIPLYPSAPACSPNSWATVSTIDSGYQPYAEITDMNNGSSPQMSFPLYRSQTIDTMHHSDLNNATGDSISELVLHTPQVSVNSSGVPQDLQSSPPQQPQERLTASPPKMPWPRSALPKGPPPVRLGQSHA
ncbi:hypothetical protein ACQKWADRAFT_274160 [Trichoderma austrokoningii]